jgi:hypothetical protein
LKRSFNQLNIFKSGAEPERHTFVTTHRLVIRPALARSNTKLALPLAIHAVVGRQIHLDGDSVFDEHSSEEEGEPIGFDDPEREYGGEVVSQSAEENKNEALQCAG